MNNDVTIIISNWNYANYLDSAVESCLAQTVRCDIIVVDDASTDLSWKVISKYRDCVKAVRLKTNSGGNARGKNVGITLSKTEYITCLDADDILLPDSVECRLNNILDKDFIHGWLIEFKSEAKYLDLLKDKRLSVKFRRPDRALKLSESATSWFRAIPGSTVLAKKKLYNIYGLYDEDMKWTIDREMWSRWLEHGVSMEIIDKYVAFYRRHAGQVTTDRKRKNPLQQEKLLQDRRRMRRIITHENTLFPELYKNHLLIKDIL